MVQASHMFRIITFLLIFGPLMVYGQEKEKKVDPDRPDVIYFPQLAEWMSNPGDSLYVINFWATWCRPCVAELPHFQHLHEELEGKPARVILISLDFIDEYDKRVV